MNPLKLRLPIPAGIDGHAQPPSTAGIRDWLASLPAQDPVACLSQVTALLERYNRCPVSDAERLASLQVLRPWVARLLPPLQKKYHDQSLPLPTRLRGLAEAVVHLLDELSQAYKQVVTDAIETPDDGLGLEGLQLALRQAIVQLGEQLLEHFAVFRAEPPGLWGELHRLYAFAERNGLHRMAFTATDGDGRPLSTIQHAYLRIALLGLAQPYRLQPGQAQLIYAKLDQWAIGVRLFSRHQTLAEAGDSVIDLDSDRPPQMATGATRFRPVDGRFLDISALRERLEAGIARLNEEQATSTHLGDRLRRDLLIRLCSVWQGRGERGDERVADGQGEVFICMGLGAAHFQLSGEADFTPEDDEMAFHRPHAASGPNLSLRPHDAFESNLRSRNDIGLETTRVSRFETERDVWSATHDTEAHARSLRESAMAGYAVEHWRRINRSDGGVALERPDEARARTRVGMLCAYRNEEERGLWQVGVVRWQRIGRNHRLGVGVQSLGGDAAAVAVRAIAGAGAGGEYFRSLLLQQEAGGPALLVPASIFDDTTQLVLNLRHEMRYVRLERLLETSNAFSLFAFRTIEMPPQERARVLALPEA